WRFWQADVQRAACHATADQLQLVDRKSGKITPPPNVICADRTYEMCRARLFNQECLRHEDVVGMGRKAIGNSRNLRRDKACIGGMSSEFSVDMPDILCAAPAAQRDCLGQ